MTKNDGTTKLSLGEIQALAAAGESKTSQDPPRADDDLPERFWQNGARVRRLASQKLIQLPVDDDVLAWFMAQTGETQSLMSEALKEYALAKGAKVG